jgi:hypothetical protein
MAEQVPIPDEIAVRKNIAERLRELALLRAILKALAKYRREKNGGDE